MLLPDDPYVYAFTRSLDHVTLVVACNVSGEHRAVRVDALTPDAELVLGNLPDPRSPVGGELVLRPWEAVVHRVGTA